MRAHLLAGNRKEPSKIKIALASGRVLLPSFNETGLPTDDEQLQFALLDALVRW